MDAPNTLRSLLALAAQGATGRLAVPDTDGAASGADDAAADLSLYLLDGHLVATHTADEARRMVADLVASGHLAPARARQLAEMSPQALEVLRRMGSDPIVGLLLEEVPEDALDASFAARFEDAVSRFVRSSTTPSFEPEALPWVDNVRMGHDTASLVARVAGLTAEDAQAIVQSLLGDVEDLDSGSFEAEPVFEDLDDVEALEAFYGDDVDAPAVDDAPPDDTPATSDPQVTAELDADTPPAEVASATEDPVDDETIPAVDPVDMETADSDPPSPTLFSPDDPTETTQVPDDDTPPSPRSPFRTDGLDDGDLEAFAGDEHDGRGGGQDGTFVAQSEHLDAVEISGFDRDGRAQPTLSAPSLSDHDARGKVGIVNDVLVAIATAFDQHRAGTGARTLQLLIDGVPREYAALMHEIRLRDDGTIPTARLLANARARPAAEQRRLLHDGLLDLLDRAFDRAADELEDDLLDALLEEVAGYRQRFGL